MRTSRPKMWLHSLDSVRLISLWLFIPMCAQAKMLEDSDPRPPDQTMKLHFITNASVTCNDGSPAGYYLKESEGSRRWLVFLQGGFYCFDKKSCDARFSTQKHLMSSNLLPGNMTGHGILSALPEENPHWWNANIVQVAYCSSDVWFGTAAKTIDSDYAFMGSLIVREVVTDLLRRGLDQAEVLLLAGTSSGSLGVMFNVDQVAEQLRVGGHTGVKVRALADSGWFLNTQQYIRTACTDILHCPAEDAAKKAFRYWRTKAQQVCRNKYPGQEWKCFFQEHWQPIVKSPVFIMQYSYDHVQLTVLNAQLGALVTEDKMRFIQNVAYEMKNALKRAKGLFIAACMSHGAIHYSHWKDLVVAGTSLPQALQCWERSLEGDVEFGMTRCRFRVMDSCRMPHCNPTCPSSINGQTLTATEYLKLFGFRA